MFIPLEIHPHSEQKRLGEWRFVKEMKTLEVELSFVWEKEGIRVIGVGQERIQTARVKYEPGWGEKEAQKKKLGCMVVISGKSLATESMQVPS